jgi:threonine dehydrogenase-like Zn-dependent dehydrogenase
MDGRLEVCRQPSPAMFEGGVRIRVAVAGLCRTDLFVARGLIPSRDELTLGHEFSGRVLESAKLTAGQKVAVFPWLGCGNCALCREGRSASCPERKMLGMHLDGGFAEEIVVPEALVHAIPEAMSFQAGAYVEPVAASLAMLQLDLTGRGFVYGQNRIGRLALKVLQANGVQAELLQDSRDLPASSYDWAVETLSDPQSMREIVRLLRPGGLLVLKSRTPRPLQLDLLELVAKELRLQAVNYGSFQQSIDLLQSGRLGEELGPMHPLTDWPLLFEQNDESSKRFFQIGDL